MDTKFALPSQMKIKKINTRKKFLSMIAIYNRYKTLCRAIECTHCYRIHKWITIELSQGRWLMFLHLVWWFLHRHIMRPMHTLRCTPSGLIINIPFTFKDNFALNFESIINCSDSTLWAPEILPTDPCLQACIRDL